MHPTRHFTLSRLLTWASVLLIWKVTLSVVIEYRNYFPPNFDATFLLGREAYFYGPYRWAFYLHLLSGPASLALGTILISDHFRDFSPRWHRRLGRVQGINVLLLLVPSGLWMSFHADTGAAAGTGLGLLALATAACMALGWRAAIQGRLVSHRRWMERTFVLLCSAVVIRVIGGAAMVAHVEPSWLYPLSAWASWLAPLLVLEAIQSRRARIRRAAAS